MSTWRKKLDRLIFILGWIGIGMLVGYSIFFDPFSPFYVFFKWLQYCGGILTITSIVLFVLRRFVFQWAGEPRWKDENKKPLDKDKRI